MHYIVPLRWGGERPADAILYAALRQCGFAAGRRHVYWRRKAPYLANAVVLFNSLGRRP